MQNTGRAGGGTSEFVVRFRRFGRVIQKYGELILQFREIRIESFTVVVGKGRLEMSYWTIVFAVDAGSAAV